MLLDAPRVRSHTRSNKYGCHAVRIQQEVEKLKTHFNTTTAPQFIQCTAMFLQIC